MRVGDEAALDDVGGLGAEPSRVPDDEVGELADLDAAHEVGEALGEGGVDRVLAHVAPDPEVVGAGAPVGGEGAPLDLVLVGRVPGAQDDLAAAAHGLGVGAHHADGAEVVQDVLGGDGLGADAALGEGHVLGYVAGEVVADHEHVEVLVEGVAGEGAGGVGRRGEHVGQGHDGDDVGRVAAAGALGVVRVDGAAAEGGDGRLDEAPLVERVRVDQALHVELVAHAQAGVDGRRRAAPVLVQLEAARPRRHHLAEGRGVRVVALARHADVDGQGVGGLHDLSGVVFAGGAGRRVGAGAVFVSHLNSCGLLKWHDKRRGRKGEGGGGGGKRDHYCY